jgi:mono/diheme cytochrome c family protein
MKTFLAICFALFTLLFINKKQDDTLKESFKRGNEIYNDFCMSCHLPSGEGIIGTFPPLANSDYLMEKRAESISSIKFGLSGEITVNGTKYNGFMSSLGLTDDEIADVMNYITNSWGNINDKIITLEEVSNIKKIN